MTTTTNNRLTFHFNGDGGRPQTLTFPDVWQARSTELYRTTIEHLRLRLNAIADDYEAEGETKVDAAVGAMGYLSWHSVTEVVENFVGLELGTFTDFVTRYTAPLLVEHFVLNDLVNERLTANIPATAEEASGAFRATYADGGKNFLGNLVSTLHKQFMEDVELLNGTKSAVLPSSGETANTKGSKPVSKAAKRKAVAKARKASKKK
jgi:hypothetical protein